MQTIAESWVEEGYLVGVDVGVERGLQAFRESLVEDLEFRFAVVPQTLVARIHVLNDPAKVQDLFRKLRAATSIEECERIAAIDATH